MSGTGSRTSRLRWAVWLLALAGAAWLAMFGNRSPPGEVVEPASRAVARGPASTAQGTAVEYAKTEVAALVSASARDSAVMPLARVVARDSLAGGARVHADLFAVPVWMTKPRLAPTPVIERASVQVPDPAQGYKVIGKKQDRDAWAVYLARGDQTLVVHVGDTLDATWHVDRIEPPEMIWKHLPTGHRQTIPIGDVQ